MERWMLSVSRRDKNKRNDKITKVKDIYRITEMAMDMPCGESKGQDRRNLAERNATELRQKKFGLYSGVLSMADICAQF